jgi:hypothetical protein
MSSPTNSQLPLRCRVIRIRSALADHPSSSVLTHCETCADCRLYFAAANQLETNLRSGARLSQANARGGFETRILHAVRNESREEHRPQRRVVWGLTAAAIAAVAAVTAFRVQVQTPNDTSPPAATVEDLLAVANELPSRWIALLQPSAVRLMEENPLQTEIALVSSDAKSALDFLAMNFLPTNREVAPTDPSSRRTDAKG